MEITNSKYRFIDLATLSKTGQRKILKLYRELLEQFPRKPKNSSDELTQKIKQLSVFNNERNIVIDPNIDISKLTDEMYDVL